MKKMIEQRFWDKVGDHSDPTKCDLYTYRVTWSDEDREYVGLCAEFPSLSWLADTQEEALRGIRKVVAESIL